MFCSGSFELPFDLDGLPLLENDVKQELENLRPQIYVKHIRRSFARGSGSNISQLFRMFCIYLTLGTSGSNVLYTTETYIGSHCTVGTITLRHDQECQSYTKSIEPDVRFIQNKDKTKEGYTNAFYASKIYSSYIFYNYIIIIL